MRQKREVEKMKKAEYMKQFVGKEFEGIISGITTWGMYVELPNTVEGMVKVTSLKDDYYYYDEEHYMLVGEHTKKSYKLGEKITIVVDGVDKLTRTIDFVLPEDYQEEEHDEDIIARYAATKEEIEQAQKKQKSVWKSYGRKREKRSKKLLVVMQNVTVHGFPVDSNDFALLLMN